VASAQGNVEEESNEGASPSQADAEPPSPSQSRPVLAARGALVAFAAIEAIALPLMLWWDRGTWFQLDDWDFLAARTGGNVGDLFRAHFEHWTTLPILAYRLMWWLFGLRTIAPYEALVILAHLTVAALLRTVMRRAGVGPWLSTVAATLFVFLGSGAENILVAFQITFVGSLAFGLGHLLLADHDGPVDRRDWLGLLAGLAGLMCSGVGVTMVVIVALALYVTERTGSATDLGFVLAAQALPMIALILFGGVWADRFGGPGRRRIMIGASVWPIFSSPV